MLPAAFLQTLPQPWLVVEDSSHMASHCLAAISYFMRSGDLLVVENGKVANLGMAPQYEGGSNVAVQRYIAERAEQYRLLTEY